MALLLAPYNAAMRIGQGFNSYTQEIKINNAVVVDDQAAGGDHYVKGQDQQISQIVTYCARHVNKLSQITDAMNLSASLSIKSGTIGGSAGGTFIDADKFKDSQINYFVQVQVTNQVVMADDVTKYVPFPTGANIDGVTFTRVYGDCFVSGFIEGGEFDALISIKIPDDAADDAEDKIRQSLEAVFGQGLVQGTGAARSAQSDDRVVSASDAKKDLSDPAIIKAALLPDLTGETTITVNWNGGGQLKPAEELWNIHTVAAAAASFPERVSHTPQRTYAILSKYTTLRTYHMHGPTENTLNYENAGIYTNMLLDLYMDYKNIYKQIHLMSYNKEFSKTNLLESNFQLGTEANARKKPSTSQPDLLTVLDRFMPMKDTDVKPAVIDLRKSLMSQSLDDPDAEASIFPATIHGLEQARRECRAQMVRLVKEVDAIIDDPRLADDENRRPQCINPVIFRRCLPREEDIPIADAVDTADPGAASEAPFPFYRQSKKGMPKWLRQWADDEVDRTKAKSFYLSDYFGDPSAHRKEKSFEDFTLVQKSSIVQSVAVWISDDRVTGVTTTYKGGGAFTHPPDPTGTQQDPFIVDVENGQKIIAVNVSGKTLDNGKKVVTAIKFGTNDFSGTDKNKIGLADDQSPVELFTVTPDMHWSLKGFWGVADADGIDGLGVLYGVDQVTTKPKANTIRAGSAE